MLRLTMLFVGLFFSIHARASMSEIDLMTRSEIVEYLWESENYQVDSDQVTILGFVKPYDKNQCDLEVATTVEYLNVGGERQIDACNVCFRLYKDKSNSKTLVEPQETYCIN